MTALRDGIVAVTVAGALIAGGSVPPETREVTPLPPVEPEVMPRSTEPQKLTLTGTASWYDYVPGGAAAGPALRSALGKHWRGQTVRVCIDTECVSVTLSDFCQCYEGEKRERVIDLDTRSFAKLAPPSRGLIKVTVSR